MIRHLCIALLSALACQCVLAQAEPGEPGARSQFQTDFITQCIPSIRHGSFSWMPQRLAPSVCQCAAPRIEARLRQLGLDGGNAHSATELATITNNISAISLDCARPAFIQAMLESSTRQCMGDVADARLKNLPNEQRLSVCACVGTHYTSAADMALAMQYDKRAEFDRQNQQHLNQSIDACLRP